MSDVRFARSGNVDIAYRVLGEGPMDLVYAQGAATHLEVYWELPQFRRYCERLAEFTRLILFDKRGMGMSDRVPGATTLEERMDDIRAVMDAVGSERAAVIGESEGGPLAILFAAAHPSERPRSSSRAGRSASAPTTSGRGGRRQRRSSRRRWRRCPSAGERAWGWTSSRRASRVRNGRGRGVDGSQLHSGTPASAEAFMRMAFDIDVRHVVPAMNVPTLIIHAAGDQVCHVENARFLARTIPGRGTSSSPGDEHVPWFDPDGRSPRFASSSPARVRRRRPIAILATVLFTDVVGSTEHAAELGDRRWRDLVEQHHAAIRRELARYDGSEVDTAGDGFFATFDGPARAIRCAQSIVDAVRPLGLGVRAGLHTGEVEVADGKVAGIAVNIGARVAGHAGEGEVLVSGTVKDLVAGSGLEFEDRGATSLKGVPGEWRLFSVVR